VKRKLFTVEDSFYFAGRQGTIVAGKLEHNSLTFKAGDKVCLIQPSGKEIIVNVSGIEMTYPPNFEKVGVWFESLTKEDVPVGTEVLLGV